MLPHTGTKSRSSSSLPDSEGGEGDNAKSVNIQGWSRVKCQTSRVKRHVSNVTCQTSRVKRHVSNVTRASFDVPFGALKFMFGDLSLEDFLKDFRAPRSHNPFLT